MKESERKAPSRHARGLGERLSSLLFFPASHSSHGPIELHSGPHIVKRIMSVFFAESDTKILTERPELVICGWCQGLVFVKQP